MWYDCFIKDSFNTFEISFPLSRVCTPTTDDNKWCPGGVVGNMSRGLSFKCLSQEAGGEGVSETKINITHKS